MISTLQDRLTAAYAEKARAADEFARASLAVEQDEGSAADLTRATKELNAANKRIAELEAAIGAAEVAEARRQAEEQAALAQAEREALNAVLIELRAVVAEWDRAADVLAEIATRIPTFEAKIRALPNGYQVLHALESCRATAVAVLEHKAASFVGKERHSPYFDPRAAGGLLALLPEPSSMVAQPADVAAE
jgi:hypothetical protein